METSHQTTIVTLNAETTNWHFSQCRFFGIFYFVAPHHLPLESTARNTRCRLFADQESKNFVRVRLLVWWLKELYAPAPDYLTCVNTCCGNHQPPRSAYTHWPTEDFTQHSENTPPRFIAQLAIKITTSRSYEAGEFHASCCVFRPNCPNLLHNAL